MPKLIQKGMWKGCKAYEPQPEVVEHQKHSPVPDSRTNIELITDYITFSRTGALAQLLVVEALNRYTQQILADEAETRRQMAHSFINGEAWIAAAREWQTMAQQNYGWDLSRKEGAHES